MMFLNQKFSSERLFRILFIVFFFAIWLGWPFLNPSTDPERERLFLTVLFPVSLTNLALFFINSHLLIPKIFRKKDVASYMLSLLILGLLFIVGQTLLKHSLGFKKANFFNFRAIFPVVFILAVSTAYGLVTFMVETDKAKQDEQKERLQSELSFLRSQISPHFIFNVLNSIVYLIRSKSDNAEAVTIKLSELMRYMLYESDDARVALGKELEYLKNYIELQKVRFEEDVNINLGVMGNAGARSIEPMLLIPFVENAFKHGVGMVTSPKIEVLADCQQDFFRFIVKNKTTNDQTESKDPSSGIGIRNVSRRLELLYPETHQLKISKENNWFLVDLRIELKN